MSAYLLPMGAESTAHTCLKSIRLACLLASSLALAAPVAWSATCGDSVLDAGEQCDDGNTVSGDGCSATCVFEGCPLTGTWSGGPFGEITWSLVEDGGGNLTGVGFTPGSPAGGFGVTGTRSGTAVSLTLDFGLVLTGTNGPCDVVYFSSPSPFVFTIARVRGTYCGDGVLQPADEACDDGNFANGDACSVACTPPLCGNSIVEGAEECDDGNTTNGDGCSTGCEANVCGNGSVEPGEECDDGNTANGDGCSSLCQSQSCGNGVVESGEQCDDGNTLSGDGCSAVCAFEPCPLTGTWSGGPLSALSWSLVEDGGGNVVGVVHASGDPRGPLSVVGTRTGFTVSLTLAGSIVLVGTNGPCDEVSFSGASPFTFAITRVRGTYCGDGTAQAPDEACDDGNFANGDACSVACTLPLCGNGVGEGAEECDDGNTTNGDGCSTGCEANVCGNGALEPGEQCDDGNTTNGDGCSATCQSQSCGNGVVESGEQCDDGNTVGGDGCSATCVFEGCPLTGTWSGGPFGDITWSLAEDGVGNVTGVGYAPGSPAGSFAVTGTRSGTAVSLTVDFGLVLTGTNGPCDLVSFSSPSPFTFGIARVRATYCGDGVLQPADETCDDGNFANADACTVACGPPSGCGDGVVDPGEACDDGNGLNSDACLTGCVVAGCGDGYVRVGAESCDDANTQAGDGCASDCTLESESASAPVGGGILTVTTDTESGGDGATPSDPIETGLSAPPGTVAGTLSITEEAAPAAPQPGFVFVGALVSLAATGVVPPPSAATPLVITFRIDASAVPGGEDETSIVVHKEGAAVPPCTGPAGEASPDPCVATRERFADGDVGLVVLTSTLSEWDLAASVCGNVPMLGCRAADGGRAKLKLRRRRSGDVVVWGWRSTLNTPKSALGDPVAGADYTLCVYDATGRVLQATAPAGGVCGGDCWAETATGFRYRNRAGTPGGVTKMLLKGSGSRWARAVATASAPSVVRDPPLEPPVRAQLRPSSGVCLDAAFSSPAVNDARTFRAVGD